MPSGLLTAGGPFWKVQRRLLTPVGYQYFCPFLFFIHLFLFFSFFLGFLFCFLLNFSQQSLPSPKTMLSSFSFSLSLSLSLSVYFIFLFIIFVPLNYSFLLVPLKQIQTQRYIDHEIDDNRWTNRQSDIYRKRLLDSWTNINRWLHTGKYIYIYI